MTSQLRIEYGVIQMSGQYAGTYKYLTTHRDWRYVRCQDTRKPQLFASYALAKEAAITAVSAILNTKLRFQAEEDDAPAAAGADFLDVDEWKSRKHEEKAVSQTFRHKKTMKPVVVEHKGKRRAAKQI
ncbi:MAG: hypothetical protein KDL10_08850 [Kiritimatiellae bacterium]|nr:hypothetical protein [Kiritimatiellia bacterium]